MNVEHASPFDDEAHLVFVMPVLAVELRQHRFEVGRLWPDVDYVGRPIAAAGLERLDLPAVGRERRVRVGLGADGDRTSSLVVNPMGGKEGAGRARLGDGGVLCRDLMTAMASPPSTHCARSGQAPGPAGRLGQGLR